MESQSHTLRNQAQCQCIRASIPPLIHHEVMRCLLSVGLTIQTIETHLMQHLFKNDNYKRYEWSTKSLSNPLMLKFTIPYN